MISKDQETGKWRYRFKFQGITYRKQGISTHRKALQEEASLLTELEMLANRVSSISFATLALKYLTDCKLRITYGFWAQKKYVLARFLENTNLTGQEAADAVPTSVFTQYRNRMAALRGNIAANRDLRHLRAMYNWADEQEILNIRNPVSKKRIPDLPEHPDRPYQRYNPPASDIAAVKLVADPDRYEFIQAVYHLLSRRIEITRLTWDDINFEKRKVTLYTRKRKGGALEAMEKPMNQTIYEILYARWKKRNKTDSQVFQFTAKELQRMMPDLCKKAQVKPFGCHSIRHHVATLLNDRNKGLKSLQLLLGHKKQSTTEIYLHSTDSTLFDAVAELEGR